MLIEGLFYTHLSLANHTSSLPNNLFEDIAETLHLFYGGKRFHNHLTPSIPFQPHTVMR
jgi:hypothetical protein